MSIAFVQATGFTNSVGSTTAVQAFSSDVTAGNAIVIAVAVGITGTATAADSQGNTYTQQAIKQYTGDTFTGWIFTASAGSSGPCTVTVTFSSSATYRTMIVAEFSGVSNPVVADGSATAQSAPSSPYSIGPISTSHADDLIVACLAGGNSGGSFSTSSGWTQAANFFANDSITLDYIVVSSTGSYTCTGTYNSSEWLGLTVALEAAAAGPITLAPAAATLAYTGGTPTVALSGAITLAPSAAFLRYSGFITSVQVTVGLGPGPATLTYSTGTPSTTPGGAFALAPITGTLIYGRFTPGVSLIRTTAAGNQLFIDGISYGTWLEGTWKMDKNLSTTATASVSLRYRSGPKPAVKQEVSMFWGGVKRFGGLIQQVDELAVLGDPFESQLNLTFTGYGSLLDRLVVAKLYTLPIGGSVAIILFDLWIQHLATLGVTFGSYGPNPPVLIQPVLFHYITLRQACTTMTDQAPGWAIWIDNNKSLQLQETITGGGGAAPFALNRASLLNSQAADSITLTISDSLFRNREWVIPSSNLVALMTDSWTGDGATVAFNTVYALSGTPIVTVGGVAQRVDILGIWTGAPCWYIPDGDGVFFHTAPGAGLVVAISYPSPFQVAAMAQDDASIAAVGPYEHVTQASNTTDMATGEAMALALLELYGPDAASPVSITFAYNSAQQSGWLEPGMLMTVAWTFPDISDSFVVQNVHSEEVGLSLWRHSVGLAKGLTGDLTGAADLAALKALLALNNVNLPHVATMELAIGGGLTVGVQPNFIRFKGNGIIQSWDARFPTDPPTGLTGGVVIDLLKNGVSIFPAGSVNQINIPNGDTNEQDGFGFVSANLAYSDGDILTLNVVQIGSINPGSNAVVHLNLMPTLAAGG